MKLRKLNPALGGEITASLFLRVVFEYVSHTFFMGLGGSRLHRRGIKVFAFLPPEADCFFSVSSGNRESNKK
jgi:hypothetical protein